MNTKEYIESGILDAYVLGALTETERAEVEAAVASNPELASELAALQETVAQMAMNTPVQPPAHMQEQIWNSLDHNNIQEIHTPKTIPLSPAPSKTSWSRAAIWVALIGSLLLNFLLWQQSRNAKDEQLSMQQQLDTLAGRQEKLVAQLDMYEHERQMMADPAMETIVMQSAQEGKTMTGMVFWSKEKGDTYLSLVNMPMPPQGKQYQLWVIQDGKPVDMGMIPNDMVYGGMQKIDKSVLKGQAFAISLEKEGGNPTPTEVMVVGNTAS